MANGQEIVSSIGVGGTESFEIEISLGQTVDVSVGDLPGTGTSPRLTIFGPDGSQLNTDSQGNVAQIGFFATQTGTYTVVVEEDGRDGELDFTIRALTLPGSPQLILGRDQALQNGEEATGFVPIGSFNVFPLQVVLGQTVDVSVGDPPGTGTTPRLTIFRPDGSQVETDSRDNVAQIDFVAAQTGTYTAVVEEDGRDGELDFTIRALTLPGSPQLVAGRDQALQNGEEGTGFVPIGSFNVFPLQVVLGQTVDVSVGDPPGSGTNPRLTIFRPDGSQVETDSQDNFAQIDFVATQTGTYTAVVEEDERDGELDFTITATGISQLPPEVIRFRRDGQTEEQNILLDRPDLANVFDISFNQDVNVSASDFTFFNETTGTPVIIPAVFFPEAFSYDEATFTVTWDFTQFSPTFFPPGLYRISASGITATSDNRPLVADVSEQVLVALPGDANLDGRVDVLNDAFALVGNLGQTGGATWAEGDFNGDGNVDVLNDAFTLVGNLGRDLIPAGGSLSNSSLLATTTSASFLPTANAAAGHIIIDSGFEDDDEEHEGFLSPLDAVFAGEKEFLQLS